MKKITLFIISFILLMDFVYADDSSSAEALIAARIKPVGQVNIAPPHAVPVMPPLSSTTAAIPTEQGKHIYETQCVVCHGAGIAGAPKLGDKAAWKPRLAQGVAVLFEHVKNGYKAMPPKGACVDCSDEALKAAIDYMIESKN